MTTARTLAPANGALKICPLCGFEFYAEDSACQHGCPLRTICTMNRCPSCDYEFTDQPRVVSWLGRLFGRGDECAKEAQGAPTVCDMHNGQRARVKGVLTSKGRRHNTLATFGLVAGSDVELLQRRPEYVIRVGETELALDADIARDILIEPSDDTAA